MRGGRRAPWRSSVCLSAQRRPSRTVSRKPFADRHQTLAQLCKSRRYPQLRKSPIRLQNGQGVLGYYLDLTTRNYPSTWSNYQRLMTKTVLSSMRSFSLTCCRYSSWLTACSRIALQIPFAGSSLCSRSSLHQAFRRFCRNCVFLRGRRSGHRHSSWPRRPLFSQQQFCSDSRWSFHLLIASAAGSVESPGHGLWFIKTARRVRMWPRLRSTQQTTFQFSPYASRSEAAANAVKSG